MVEVEVVIEVINLSSTSLIHFSHPPPTISDSSQSGNFMLEL